MKFEIGQVVYFLDYCSYKMVVRAMKITKISKFETEDCGNNMHYNGTDTHDQAEYLYLWEPILFATAADVIENIEGQLQDIKKDFNINK